MPTMHRRARERTDWLDGCSKRTGFLLLCLSAALFVAGVVAACRVLS